MPSITEIRRTYDIDDRPTTFILLGHAASPDADLWTVRIEWMHGIFKTQESEVCHLWMDIDGVDDRIIWSAGHADDLDRDNPVHETLIDFVLTHCSQ